MSRPLVAEPGRKARSPMLLAAALACVMGVVGSAGAAAAGERLLQASDARDLAYPAIGTLRYEEARAFFVDGQGRVLKTTAVTQRMQHGVYVIPWELAFGDRAPAGTRRVYLVHNHPGGNPELSEADIRLGSFWAARAADEGITLDLLAITAQGDYTSLQESGLVRPVPKGVAAALEYAGYVVAPGVQMAGSRLVDLARSLLR
ncbi:MAG: JAB domain-containing protein [Chitinophagales bacterium]